MSSRDQLGRIVFYTLTDQDVAAIEQSVPRINSTAGANLNPVSAGLEYPALVVRDSGGSVNLKVQLDGGADAVYWATSRVEGTEQGQWQR